MNNMLRYVVYILLFLLFTITVDQDHYTVEPTDLHPQTSCYQQQQDPCKRTVDFLFNRFDDVADFPDEDAGVPEKFAALQERLRQLQVGFSVKHLTLLMVRSSDTWI